ncbi:Uncharacterised protein [Vibrio cholerae]|nr:Uncharacterised protein [Vibrio cholerae]
MLYCWSLMFTPYFTLRVKQDTHRKFHQALQRPRYDAVFARNLFVVVGVHRVYVRGVGWL